MFLRFFRSSFFSQYLAIILAGLLLWGRAFFVPPMMPVATGPVPLYKLLYLLLSGLPLLAVFLGVSPEPGVGLLPEFFAYPA